MKRRSSRQGALGWPQGFVSLGILWLAISAPGNSLPPRELRLDHVERISVQDGLSHSTVWDLHQDSRDFLWIATESYLHRYDGYEFKIIKHDPEDPDSLSASEVTAIYEDRRGILWFGTRGAGINRFDRADERFTHYRHDPADPHSFSPGRVWTFLEDGDGVLWIGTTEGLSRLEGETFTHYIHDPSDPDSLSHNSVQALLIDRAGTMWIGTKGGLDRLDKGSGGRRAETFAHYRHDPNDERSLAFNEIRALYEDSEGTLWIGGQDGTLHRLAGAERGEFIRYGHDPSDPASAGDQPIWVMHEDRAGTLWVGSYGDGLSRFDRDTGTFAHFRHDPNDPYSLSSNDVRDICEDRTGILWIATRGGISKVDPRQEQFRVLRNQPGHTSGLAGHAVTAIAEDRAGVLWIGAQDGGLTAFREMPKGELATAMQFRHQPGIADGLPHGTVRAILEDRHGELWVGTRAGLVRLDQERRDVVSFPTMRGQVVLSLFEDSFGAVWVGTTDLYRFDEDGGFIKYTRDPANRPGFVYNLYEDRAGRLWVATERGLWAMEPGPERDSGTDSASAAFRFLRHDPNDRNSLSDNFITAVNQDGTGTFWIGTYGGGLNRWHPESDEWRHYRERDGLANDKVDSLLVDDDGTFWISTNGGLSHFDPRSENFRNYDVDDGLHGQLFYIGAALATSRGEMIFGGEGGLTAFFPGRLESDSMAPSVRVTELRIGNEPAALARRDPSSPLERSIIETEELVFTHRQKTFSFEFAAFHFGNPHKSRYSYRLEGYDDIWIDTDASQRFARYTNLDPEDYVFRVKASNKNGFWNEEGASIRVRVLPPPWRSWWAYALYAVASLAAIWGFVYSQNRKVERERAISHERKGRIEERQRLIDDLEATNKELERFNYAISHDLRNPLVTIKNFLGLLAKDLTAGNADRVSHDLELIVKAADKMEILLDELLNLSGVGLQQLRTEEISFEELIYEAIKLVAPPTAENQVEIRVATGLPVIFGDRGRLLEMVKNLIENSIMYMGDQANPIVRVGMRQSDAGAIFYVRDNGMGIDSRYHKKIFGLFDRLNPEEGKGTGIGLALVKRIAEIHGGRIWIESEGAGHGSTFCFTLPVVDPGGEARPS